jgi:hypothetical protein
MKKAYSDNVSVGHPQSVRDSILFILSEGDQKVHVDQSALARLSQEVNGGAKEVKFHPSLVLPLQFPTLEAHINFLTFIHLPDVSKFERNIKQHLQAVRERVSRLLVLLRFHPLLIFSPLLLLKGSE